MAGTMKTVPEVYEKIGRARIQKQLDLKASSLTDALTDGRFPARWYAPMKKMAEEDGLELPLSLFHWRNETAA